jgi:hypothetical protein
VFLIQVLIPIDSETAREDERVGRTRLELVERFGGITAYVQTPAQGEWISPGGRRERDRIVMVEVVAEQFDRAWWRSYARTLALRFDQDVIHVRGLRIELLDPDAA